MFRLAASIAAEEEGTLIGNEAPSTSQFPHEEEFDEDEYEEMAIVSLAGKHLYLRFLIIVRLLEIL